MSLPDQTAQATYTQDDMQHIVAREMAKQQLVQLQNGQIELNKKLVEIIAEFNAEIKGLREMIQNQPQKVELCKTELRDEIKLDHPDRLEILRLERDILARIEALDTKVEKQWLKITMTFTVLATAITASGVLLNYFLLVKQVIQ